MAEALAGALLSASVQTLMETITSVQFRDFFRNTRKLNESLLDELETTLLVLQAVLNDAEQKQITNPAVKEWLERLKDAVHDAEDLIDEVNTDALRHKLEIQHPNQSAAAGKVRSFFCSSFQFHGGLNSKLEALCHRLQRFVAQRSGLGLQLVSTRVSVRAPTSSVANESGVVGRDDDKEKLMRFLLSDDVNCNSSIGVITIFGMGGVGKTTIAQLLYNDRRVEQHFDLKAWTSISEVFDAALVTKALLESAASKHFEGDNLDFLRIELKRMVKGKKFLFVLDDLWNNRYVDWDDLRSPFSEGKQGSRIIITTRQGDVAQMTHTFPVHHLEPLSHEDCWSLLSKHSFENTDPGKYPNLEVVGRKIAEKCGGLPIAAKTLGGILRSKVDENEWINILNSNIWELLNDNVLPALWLSYLYLPANLKRCFAYCSVFPKGFPLNRKHMVLLWMAEGLLQQGQNKSMEEIGNQYFDELLSRSIIQQDGESYVMHDLINDLAAVVSGKSCARFEGRGISESVRHFSYSRGKYDSSTKFENCYRAKCLRLFLPLPLTDDPTFWWYWKHYLTKRVTHDFLLRQRCLRVLSLANYNNIIELPNSIGNLIHLRFLDLSFTPIKRLPTAIFKLYNLQTLRLLYCQNLTELPADIGNLVNMRHLDMTGTKLKMPRQITTLQNLQTLSAFVVGKDRDGLSLNDLRCFPNLHGKLEILELCNVDNKIDAIEANLKNKELIEELVLDWSMQAGQGSQIEAEVLELMQPSTNLRTLAIESYNGTGFPNWLADPSFVNIVFLSISGCNFCLFLPPLGQLPSLKELYVTRMKMIKTVGPEFYGASSSSSFQPFSFLEILSFEEMLDWEEWLAFNGEGIDFPFPSLKHLRLYNCPKLKGHLPHHLPSSLTDVNISYCDQLEASTLHWITSAKSLTVVDGSQNLFPFLENDSHCLLSSIKIEKSDWLTAFPRMVLSSNFLRDLYLTKILSLPSFPTESMPTLRTLMVSECKNLEFLPSESWANYSSLENLMIWDSCHHSLSCFPLGCFPVLKYLDIWSCPNLKSFSISDGEAFAQSLSSLQILRIRSCPNLKSFPQSGLSTPNLMEFKVIKCGKLRSLPDQMHTLNALQDLEISKIPQLVSFPQGGLPPKLQSVYIGFCESLSALAVAQNGFQWLASLLKFGIGGDDLVRAFLEGNVLQHLTSLEVFHILKCSKIESLPEDKLPSSLSLLRIQDCPLLEARYKTRKYMSKISHIPTIRINEEVII